MRHSVSPIQFLSEESVQKYDDKCMLSNVIKAAFSETEECYIRNS